LLMLAGEGRAEEDAIVAAEAAGSLTPADAAQIRETDATARQAAETKRARIDRVAAAAGPLDPDLPEDQAAVDAYWETVSEAFASDDAAQQQTAQLTFAKTVGVLPTALANRYRGALLSGDPALTVPSAQDVAELERTDARLVSALPADEVRLAHAIDEFAALDLPPDRAVELGEQKAATAVEDATAAETLPDNAVVLAELPDAIAELLAEEGMADDAELAAGLTQITTAVLAADLPLNDETAEMIAALASGDGSVDLEVAGPLLPLVAGIARGVQFIGRLIGPLLQRLRRRGRKENPEPPPIPIPPLPETPSEREGGQEEGEGVEPDAPQSPILPEPEAATPTEPEEGLEKPSPLVGAREEEAAARQVGLDVIRRLKGSDIDFDATVSDRIATVAAQKFAGTKRNKVSLSLEDLGPNLPREKAIKSFVDA
ncbi:MAG: hypothetical protein MJE12_08960, partial [Alphaproteobacteria bacterium]|nr:hypothetical protein [Alphaproteobacteria bacterium]